MLRDYGMHHVLNTDDRIDRAHARTEIAADARGLVDTGDVVERDRRAAERAIEWNRFFAEQARKASDRLGTARRAKVDRSPSIRYGLGVGPAAREAALATVNAWQTFFNGIGERLVIARRKPRGNDERERKTSR